MVAIYILKDPRMKILITGSTGFIGKNLLEHFSENDCYPFTRGENLYVTLRKFRPDMVINSAAEIYEPHKMWEQIGRAHV